MLISTQYRTFVTNTILAVILLLLLDLYIFPSFGMFHNPFKHFFGPKGIQNILLAAILGVFLFYYLSNKETTVPFISQPDSITSSGKIKDMHVNGIGDIDGMVLENDLVLKFPPHTASDILQVVDSGQYVEVTYETKHKKHKKHKKCKLISITNSDTKKSFNPHSTIPAFPGERGELVTLTLDEKRFYTDKKGKIKALMDGKNLIKINHHAIKKLLPLINQADTIKIQGIKRERNSGFVNYYQYQIVKATSIEIDNNTYVLY